MYTLWMSGGDGRGCLAEWLRRRTWNRQAHPLGNPRVGSNPAAVARFFCLFLAFWSPIGWRDGILLSSACWRYLNLSLTLSHSFSLLEVYYRITAWTVHTSRCCISYRLILIYVILLYCTLRYINILCTSSIPVRLMLLVKCLYYNWLSPCHDSR